jgi:hypothetical protein
MKINDLAYELLEIVQKTVKDDFFIDIRLLKDFIKDQRAVLLERAFDDNDDFYRFVQIYNKHKDGVVNVELLNSDGYLNSKIVLLKSTEKITPTLLLQNRHAITKVSPKNFLIPPFKFVNYDEAIYSGGGKFNRYMNVSFIRDGYLYIKANDNQYTRNLTDVVVEGIFENPLLVPGFDEDNDDYPISAHIWNNIIDMVMKNKISIKIGASDDVINNATNA